jgi:hypothetical protein
MTPTPEQIAEWRAKFESDLPEHRTRKFESGEYNLSFISDMWQGYKLARTEQATEIAELNTAILKLIGEVTGCENCPNLRIPNRFEKLCTISEGDAFFGDKVKENYQEITESCPMFNKSFLKDEKK